MFLSSSELSLARPGGWETFAPAQQNITVQDSDASGWKEPKRNSKGKKKIGHFLWL